jgi:hypothetical protein
MKDDLMLKLRDVLGGHPGKTPVILCLEFPSGEKVFLDTDMRYKVTGSEALVRELEALVGEGKVYVAVIASACRKPKRAPRFRDNGGNGGFGRGV